MTRLSAPYARVAHAGGEAGCGEPPTQPPPQRGRSPFLLPPPVGGRGAVGGRVTADVVRNPSMKRSQRPSLSQVVVLAALYVGGSSSLRAADERPQPAA